MLTHTNWKETYKQFWKYKKGVWEWNIWYGIILQMTPDSSLVTVWAVHSQDRERGWWEKGDCKAIHELHFVFFRCGSLVPLGRREGSLLQELTPAARLSRRLPAHTGPGNCPAGAARPLCNPSFGCAIHNHSKAKLIHHNEVLINQAALSPAPA